MAAFEALGTPMGVLIAKGIVVSPVAAGADAVLELAAGSPKLRPAQAATTEPPVGHWLDDVARGLSGGTFTRRGGAAARRSGRRARCSHP